MQLLSNMSGLIHAIQVGVGDRVASGDVVAVVESMKMLIEVKADKAGVIQQVLCKAEDFVQEGQALFDLEV